MVTGQPPLQKGNKGASIGTAVFYFFKRNITQTGKNVNILKFWVASPLVVVNLCFSECLKYFVINVLY